MNSGDGDPRLDLAYEESVRALALQSSVLDELRNRAGVLLSAASVSAAFLGAKTLEGGQQFSALSVAATIAFALVVLLCMGVIWPSANWTFVHDAKKLVTVYVKNGVSAEDMERKMTLANARYRIENDEAMRDLFRMFRFACVGLGVDVILWLVDLGTQR